MAAPPSLPPEARRILKLGDTDRAAARSAFSEYSTEAQVALVCATPVSERGRLLDLAAHPERLIPALPPAELCYTAKAVGLHDAGWLLEHAVESQLTTCIDLDAWSGPMPDREKLHSWLLAFADAGEDTLHRAAKAIDFECLTILMGSRVAVVMKTSDDDWEPPAGGRTIDGQFYVVALSENDDLTEVMEFLRVLFQRDYWVYFRLVQSVIWELDTENEEWANRWRTGRLEDLGYPTWEESMRIYGHLREDELDQLPDRDRYHELGSWPLPIFMPSLPLSGGADLSIYRALAGLADDERAPHLLAFLALANRIAIADGLELGDAESMPKALLKAARLASRGLDHLTQAKAMDPTETIRRVSLERIFRVGFNLEKSPPGQDR